MHCKEKIKDCSTRLSNIEKILRNYLNKEKIPESLLQTKNILYEVLLDLNAAYQEYSSLYSITNPKEEILNNALKSVFEDNLSDKTVLEEFINKISELFGSQLFVNNDYSLLQNSSLYRCYEVNTRSFSLNCVGKIIDSIKKDRNFNILYPSYGSNNNFGLACKNATEKSIIYKVDDEEDYYSYVDENEDTIYNAVLTNGIKKSKISNETFDMLILNPRIEIFNNDNSLYFLKQIEKSCLTETVQYLRDGGILLYVIPYFRFSKEICSYLAKNFEQIQVRKAINVNFYDNCCVYLTGVKKSCKDKTIDSDAYSMLRHICNLKTIKEYDDDSFEGYCLPENMLEVKIFKNTHFSDEKLAAYSISSDTFNNFCKINNAKKTNDHKKYSPLPFNLGHIGLILASGCIDGLIDEKNGCYHVVRGRVTKIEDASKNFDPATGNEEEVKVLSNRVEINVFLPDGKYMLLT